MKHYRRLSLSGSEFILHIPREHQLNSVRGDLCMDTDEHFMCTLEHGHVGRHEAYDSIGTMQHAWYPKRVPTC